PVVAKARVFAEQRMRGDHAPDPDFGLGGPDEYEAGPRGRGASPSRGVCCACCDAHRNTVLALEAAPRAACTASRLASVALPHAIAGADRHLRLDQLLAGWSDRRVGGRVALHPTRLL